MAAQEEIIVKLTADANGYKVGLVGAGSATKRFSQDVESASKSLKLMASEKDSLRAKMRDLTLTMASARFALQDIHDLFLRLPMSMLKTSGELERVRIMMAGVSGETDELKRKMAAEDGFNFVTDMAKNAPFEIGAISDSFVKLKTAGIDPTNGSLQTLIDGVAKYGGTSDVLKRATVAIQQMAGKGVVSMEELRQQLGEAMPDAIKAMATGLGMSVAQLSKAVSTGTVEATGAIEKMLSVMSIKYKGAAAEMMQSWSGHQSRLKSEYQIMVDEIVQSTGMGDAAKAAIRDVIDMLKDPAFREGAAGLANGFKEAIQYAQAFGKALGENWEMISATVKLLGPMLIVLKAWKMLSAERKSKGGQAMPSHADNIAGAFTSVGGIRTEMALIRQREAERNKAVSAEMTSMYALSQQKGMELAAERARLRNETETIRAHLEERRRLHERNAIAINAAKSEGRGKVSIAGSNGDLERNPKTIAQAEERMRSLDKAIEGANKRYAENLDAIKSVEREMQTNYRSALTEADSLRKKKTESTKLGTIATAAATRATQGFSAISAALGGPIGIAITAITLLVGWYYKLKDSADQASAAMDRAKHNKATAADYDNLLGQQKGAQEELEKRRKAVDALAQTPKGLAEGSVAWKKRQEYLAGAIKEMQAAEAQVKSLNQAVSDADRQTRTQRGEAAGDRYENVVGRTFAEQDRKAKDQLAKFEKAQEDRRKEVGEKVASSVEFIKAEQLAYGKLVVEINQKSQISAKAALDTVNSRYLAAAASLGSDSKEATELNAMRERAKKRFDDTTASLKAAQEQSGKTLTNMKLGPAEKKKGGGGGGASLATPLYERLMEDLEAENLNLQVQLDTFDAYLGKGNEVQAKLAEERRRWELGDAKYAQTIGEGKKKIKKALSKEEYAAFEKQLEKKLNAEQILKGKQKDAESFKRVTDDYEDIAKRMEDVALRLDDPLGTAKGKNEKRAQRQIEKYDTKALDAFAASIGKTSQQVKDSMLGAGAMTDVADVVQAAADETSRINSELESDSESARVRRMEAAHRETAALHEENIKRAISAGMEPDKLRQVQQKFEDWKIASEKRLEHANRSAVRRMLDEWGNYEDRLNESTAGWAGQFTDALGELVTTGKADFKSLAVSILADLAKMELQLAASRLFGAGGGSGNTALGILGTVLGSIFSPGAGYGSGNFTSNFGNPGTITNGPMPSFGSPTGGFSFQSAASNAALSGFGAQSKSASSFESEGVASVTSRGGDKVNITINVAENGQSRSSASGGKGATDWSKMGERIKDVVREELVNQKRAGGILYS